ncbi:hypothetical protein [Pedobacter jamesrossensis]|uniref:Uncharacterized protein n=1 Tax=Pedobacter jamesrossensis TaxID=1908238 RepID=A0ABV8NPE9_9SPHI
MKKILFILFALGASTSVMAQSYTPKVSKDSVGILTNRIEVLKSSIKVLKLKIEEAKEEEEVEKLRLKLLEANGIAKASAEQSNNNSAKTTSGTSVDLKAMEKFSKKAKSDSENAIKALERFNKQIAKVEDLRTQIQGEERKLSYKKPQIAYSYK